MRTLDELREAVGPCPICGADGYIYLYPRDEGKIDGCIGAVCCCGEPTDGGPTYCGAKLDAAIDLEALGVQVDRWNGVYKGGVE